MGGSSVWGGRPDRGRCGVVYGGEVDNVPTEVPEVNDLYRPVQTPVVVELLVPSLKRLACIFLFVSQGSRDDPSSRSFTFYLKHHSLRESLRFMTEDECV